jgi:hypothetical protein
MMLSLRSLTANAGSIYNDSRADVRTYNQLQPLNRADYNVTLTDAQWARLQNAFPQGVCDYSKEGVGQQPPTAPWLDFSAGPGGIPLGPSPESQ